MEENVQDFVQFLPQEVLEAIFTNVGEKGIHSSLLTCRTWSQFVDNDSFIWKDLCRNFDKDDVQADLANGLSWKAIFLNNQGTKGVVRRWLKGRYSNLKSHDQFGSQRIMAVLEAETWGLILEAEFSR